MLQSDRAVNHIEPEPGARSEDDGQPEDRDQPEVNDDQVAHQQDDNNVRLTGRCQRDGNDTQSPLDDSADDNVDSDDSDADGEYTL